MDTWNIRLDTFYAFNIASRLNFLYGIIFDIEYFPCHSICSLT